MSKIKLLRESQTSVLVTDGKQFRRVYRENGELMVVDFWSGSLNSYLNYLRAQGRKLPTEIYVSVFTPVPKTGEALAKFINKNSII